MSDQIPYEQQLGYLEARVQQQSPAQQEQPQPQEPTAEQLEQEQRRLQELDAVLHEQDHNTYTRPNLDASNTSARSSNAPSAEQLAEERRDSDARSIYIGNVDYQAYWEDIPECFVVGVNQEIYRSTEEKLGIILNMLRLLQ